VKGETDVGWGDAAEIVDGGEAYEREVAQVEARPTTLSDSERRRGKVICREGKGNRRILSRGEVNLYQVRGS